MTHKKYASFILYALLVTVGAVFLVPNEAFSSIVGVGSQIGNDTVANGTLGTPYSAWIAASGSAPHSWKLESGSLPSGLKWAVTDSNYGGRIDITGTPTMPGTFTFRFYVWNWVSANYNVPTARKDFTVVIKGPSRITTTSLPVGTEGVLYNQTLRAHGSVLNWVIDAGALPDGLHLSSNGVIFGTPTKAGTFSFSVKTTNSWVSDTKVLSIVINSSQVTSGTPTITTSSLPEGTAGTTYNQTLSATGSTPITWSIGSGSLPNGLSINGTTGVISGTPAMPGTFSFAIKAMNATGSDVKTLNVVINSSQVTSGTPTITTSSLPEGTAGTAYNQTLSATGSTPITWSIGSGSLPNGLSINGTTGVISGTPAMPGTFNFAIKAMNATGSDAKVFSIAVYAEGGGSNSGGGGGGGGGGGCNVGFGILPISALIFSAIMLMQRKR